MIFLFLLVNFLLLNPTKTDAKERCCDGFGCFTDDDPFHDFSLPDCPEKIDPSMRMYTRENRDEGQVITPTTIPPAYKKSQRTVWVVHGWLQGKNDKWLHTMKDAFLDLDDFNVIVTGWGGASKDLWYWSSAGSTRTVGAWIAKTADELVNHAGADPSGFWCVGHSLGAHTCGHAGKRTHLGRISAMDPAGPWFENKDYSVGIRPEDADFVDVWHTNGKPGIVMALGQLRTLGHVDFYPNGGGVQPGCILDPIGQLPEYDGDRIKYMQAMIDLTPACSHLRAIDLFIESLRNGAHSGSCQFTATMKCTDERDIPDSCEPCENCQVMGPLADQLSGRGVFYMTTSGKKPYCK